MLGADVCPLRCVCVHLLLLCGLIVGREALAVANDGEPQALSSPVRVLYDCALLGPYSPYIPCSTRQLPHTAPLPPLRQGVCVGVLLYPAMRRFSEPEQLSVMCACRTRT